MKHSPSVLLALVCVGCGGPTTLTVDMPLHLEDHIDAATVTGSELPANPPQPVEWRFDQPQPDWKATPLWNPPFGAPMLARTGEGLRVTLTDETRVAAGLRGAIHVDLPDWDRGDWADIVIRARADSASSVDIFGFGFNLREGRGQAGTDAQPPFQYRGQQSPVVRDGTIQTYRLRVGADAGAFQGPWRQLVLYFGSDGEPGSIDILSVSVIPTARLYSTEGLGMQSISIGHVFRRSLFTHAPGRVAYRVRVPKGGRLETALGVLGTDNAVEFRVLAEPDDGDAVTLLSENHEDEERWAERSVDLSVYAGQTLTLSLETDADEPGTVAFWGAPTVSGTARSSRPNVILYVIDGGGADFMSVYGYNRRTTPNLEWLAAEGAVFEHAYSNSSWTKPSTASFMTSLHNSVLGFTGGDFDPLPEQALTMAQRFHAAGYQTAVFTSNPNAGTSSGLQRGADLLRESEFQRDATSSVELHQAFWNWRATNPGQPYWVHVQTTDVHAITAGSELDLRAGVPVPPFAGLFVSPDEVDTLRAWSERVLEGRAGNRSTAFTTVGVSRAAYLTLLQGLYDEQMAHNDYQLGRLIDRLKATGEWSNTLLIVTADHSLDGFFGTDMTERLDTVPPDWTWSTLRATVSHIPLVVVWPGRIAGGQRFDDPVSLIDLLPTVLDLAGLPPPEVMQGQSLGPLVRGQSGWTSRPVIMDEIVTFGGEDRHIISVVDGRWGASKKFGPPLKSPGYLSQPWPVLLFDVRDDPMGVAPVNDAHPALVVKYTTFLDDTWNDHEALAKLFKPGTTIDLTPEQLERLRALGYIR